MDKPDYIKRIVLECGLSDAGYIDIKRLRYEPEVRKICEGNMCRNYGTTWACPPAVGSLEDCLKRIQQYQNMLLFLKVYKLEDSFDLEGVQEGHRDFQRTADTLYERVEKLLPRFLLLSNEGCNRCASCTYPDAVCRFPQKLHHSLEGYGFIVSNLAKEAGIRYINGANTVTYFGALIFDS